MRFSERYTTTVWAHAYLGLYGIFCDELEDVHGLGLSNAITAIDSLTLDAFLPPRVHEVDVIGDGQIQAESARLGAF